MGRVLSSGGLLRGLYLTAEAQKTLKTIVTGMWKGEGAGFLRQALPLVRRDVMTSSLSINILLLAFPLAVLQVYDRIIPNASLDTLIVLIVGVVVALLLDIMLKWARGHIAGWTGAHFEHHLGLASLKLLLHGPIEKVERDSPGKHLDRLAGVDQVRDFYAGQASLILVDLPFVVIFLGVMFYIAGLLALVPVVLLGIFAAIAVNLGVKLRAALSERNVWDDRRYSFIIETLSGIHTIKSNAMEPLILRRYERLMESCSSSGMRVSYLSSLALNLGSTFSQITMASVVAVGSLFVVGGQLTMGGLAACMLLAGRSVQPVLRALGVWTRFQAIQVAEAKIEELASLKKTGRQVSEVDEPLESIELRDVRFAYEDGGANIIDGASLQVDIGETVGIRGGNGSGKSTLLALAMGRLQPNSGQVVFNGQPIGDIALGPYRRQIAYLPQRPVLFEGTVLENLTMFQVSERLEEALEMAARMGLDKVFARYPEGFETRIGNNTHSSLPGGVGQRIAIARALLNRPRFVLFDEANTGLDAAGDDQLRAVLEEIQPHTGIILVTYRPSLLSLASRRFDLFGGQLHPAAAGGTK